MVKRVPDSNRSHGNYRKKTKSGTKYAIIATTGKIATIYYKMLRYKKEFTRLDFAEHQQKHKLTKVAYLERTLKRLKDEAA